MPGFWTSPSKKGGDEVFDGEDYGLLCSQKRQSQSTLSSSNKRFPGSAIS
jgi:hypothetical protein